MIQMSGIGTYIKTLMGHGIYAVALGDDKDILKYDESVQVINYDEKIYGAGEQLHFPFKELKRVGSVCCMFRITMFRYFTGEDLQ